MHQIKILNFIRYELYCRKKENDSVHFELSEDTFDSQKPSTSRTALRHTRHTIDLSDSSDDSFNDRQTSRQDSSNLNEEHKNKSSDTKPSLKKCRNSSTDSTEDNSDFKNEGMIIFIIALYFSDNELFTAESDK